MAGKIDNSRSLETIPRQPIQHYRTISSLTEGARTRLYNATSRRFHDAVRAWLTDFTVSLPLNISIEINRINHSLDVHQSTP